MNTTTKTFISLVATASLTQAASLVDITFSDLADGDLTNGTTITNTSGTNGLWDGGTATVSSGTVDTSTNDGYINYASGHGLVMDLSGSNAYTFTAQITIQDLTANTGVFGQINSWTSDNSEYWMRLTSAEDYQILLRDSTGTQIVHTFDTSAALIFGVEHTLSLVIDGTTAEAFVDGNSQGTVSTTTLTGGTIGTAGDRAVIGAYNSTAGNRFDGIANSYSITSVPEPSSTALLGLAGLALILRRRK
ncbi:PEP-CTERM sorting domain-containing protein [Rubritalea tangerina]|uniref:PEP-CTERM sorting domain-containing protein n=2 Tax=Rubritalea tangerina TaxID=430798 RepID=A0ABW4Z6U3_9BACT